MKKAFLFSAFCVFIMGCGADNSSITLKDLKLDDETKKLVESMKKAGAGVKGFDAIRDKIGYDDIGKLDKKLLILTPNYTSILNLSDPKKTEDDLRKEEHKISDNCNNVDEMIDWMVKDNYRMKVAEVNNWAYNLCWKKIPILKDEKENKKMCDTVTHKNVLQVYKDYPEVKKARDEYFKDMDAKGVVTNHW